MNGEDGLTQLRRQIPYVVLLDLNLPEIDGIGSVAPSARFPTSPSLC